MTENSGLAVWFPAVRAGTGADVFTERLASGLAKRGIRTEITWLPLRAEYAPWTVPVPTPPEWAIVAHINSWLHPRFVPKQLPVVATIHHSLHHPDVRPYKSPARSLYHRFWIAPNERLVLRQADRVVAVSRFVAQAAKRSLVDVPMDVIYNGANTERFEPGQRKRGHGEPFRLLYVGSWKKLKGVDLLAPIMRELGEGFELRYTGGHAAERGKRNMPKNMHDIGRLNGESVVAATMQEADAFLFPSRSEGHPQVVVEAMACGLPIIAMQGSSLAEVVEDGVTGVLCPRDDVAAFAAAVQRLAMDPICQNAFSSAARNVAIQCLSEERMVEAYVDLYRGIAIC